MLGIVLSHCDRSILCKYIFYYRSRITTICHNVGKACSAFRLGRSLPAARRTPSPRRRHCRLPYDQTVAVGNGVRLEYPSLVEVVCRFARVQWERRVGARGARARREIKKIATYSRAAPPLDWLYRSLAIASSHGIRHIRVSPALRHFTAPLGPLSNLMRLSHPKIHQSGMCKLNGRRASALGRRLG